MRKEDQGQDFGSQLPGTGGDLIDGGDVEGHSRNPRIPTYGDQGEGVRGPGGHLPSVRGPGGHLPSVDGDDVEGHGVPEGEGVRGPGGHLPSVRGPGGHLPSATEGEDTEGHVRNPRLPSADGGEGEGVRGPGGHLPSVRGPGGHLPSADGSDDVEGHLYTGGPTTQGEIIARGPGDNPHGER